MGNFISKLFGSSKQETDKQAPKPQEAASKAISDYSGMSALQRREKAAGLKAGGMVRKNMVKGGPIEGPGGPTDDLVPIDASNEEFMIKASSAKILGPELLEALNDVGDEPKNPKDDAQEDAKEGMKVGGMVRQPVIRMAEAGSVDEARRRAEQLAKIPTGGTAPAPDGLSAGNDFTRNVATTAGALPGVGGALAGGAALASAIPSVVRGIAAAAPMAGKALGMAKTAAPYAVPAAGYAALQASSSSPATPIQTATLGATSPGAPSAPATPTVAPAAPVDEFSNAAISQRNPGGMVRKVVGPDGRTSYSGSNVTGEVSFQGADGNALRGRPGGGFMTYGGMSPEAIKQTLTNPDGSQWSAGDNAIMAANIRDGVDKYRGTSRDARNDPMNQPMTKDQRAARVRMAEVNSQDKRYAQSNAMEQAKLGMSQTEHISKMARDKQLADAQAEYLAAGNDPVKLKAAERKLIVLGNKDPSPREKYAAGRIGTEADGTTPIYGTYNTETGLPPTGGKAAVPDAETAKTQALAALKANPANKDEINKRLAAAGYQPI